MDTCKKSCYWLCLLLMCFACKDDNDKVIIPVEVFQDDILLNVDNLSQADFVEGIDNPYFSLSPGFFFVYEGIEEEGEEVRVVEAITFNTKEILGITCREVLVSEYEDGELVEETLDWYAQDKNGNVWYFGEDSKEIEDGEVVSTEGSWQAGRNGAKPGVIMLANPQPGQKYRQEFAEGIAEDQGEVIRLTASVAVPYGSFQNCLQIKDINPLEPDSEEFKYYASGVGLLLAESIEGEDKEELVEITDLVDKVLLDIEDLDSDDFVTVIDNPYLSYTPGTTYTYTGVDDEGTAIMVVEEVTANVEVILGVNCTVVKASEYEDGELVEETLDWYAQDKNGNVWYFGEDSKEIEDGEVVSTEGSWRAGEDGAEPGIIMLAEPLPGLKYRQEFYEGEAEDRAEVIGFGFTITVPYGTFTDCLKTREHNPLEPDAIEYKYYAEGIGFIKAEKEDSDEVEELEEISQ
ncbi:hypothetical protein AAG747_04415 [Rapidithrix thailandica]|uniref:Uncharacterized protein n=1 Tax=Rapidithrix thailandica TaxID=413964 RepID=A0AAW9RQG2_9BACT